MPQKAIRIVIFAKAPLPGLAKTRLLSALGPEGSSCLAIKLLEHTVEQAVLANIGPVELCVSPTRRHSIWKELTLPVSLDWSEQGEGDLGERLARATRRITGNGQAIILIGTDCPSLNAEKLCEAAQALERHDACMVPVSDGGYALLGLNRHLPEVFSDMPWSSTAVARLTRQRMLAECWTFKQLAPLHDIDEPQDLQYLPENWPPRFTAIS